VHSTPHEEMVPDKDKTYLYGNVPIPLIPPLDSEVCSRKGGCYDNAPMESFWETLKMDYVL